MQAHTCFAARSAIAAFALGLFIVLAGRAYAETPTQFNLAQEGATANPQQSPAKHHFQGRKTAVWAPPPASPVSIFAGDVVREFERHLGQGNFTGRPGAWCAWAVSAVLVATGHRPLASGMAASALAYGPRLAGARPGALAVLASRRGRITHVGLVVAVRGDSVEMISGNWGHRVARAVLPRAAFAAFIAVT